MALSEKQKEKIRVGLALKKADEAIVRSLSGAGKAGDVADIADPASSDAEECANKINEILAALRQG